MSTAAAIEELNEHLVNLTLMQEPVPSSHADLDIALLGRASVISLGRGILADLHRSEPRWKQTLGDFQNKPGRALYRAFLDSPTLLPEKRPTDSAARARGLAARSWRSVTTSATSGHHHWSAAERLPSHHVNRSIVSDLAVVALGLAHLEGHISRTARHLGRESVVRELARTASGLTLASHNALRQAHPNHPWDAQATIAADDLRVVPVSRTRDLVPAIDRLRTLLMARVNLTPGHTALLVAGQARMCTAAATADRSTSMLTPINETHPLVTHARALARCWSPEDSKLASLTRPDPRPVLQTGEILRFIERSAPAGDSSPISMDSMRKLTIATSVAIDDQIRAGHWASASSVEGIYGRTQAWRILSAMDRPAVADRVRALAAEATIVGRTPKRPPQMVGYRVAR